MAKCIVILVENDDADLGELVARTSRAVTDAAGPCAVHGLYDVPDDDDVPNFAADAWRVLGKVVDRQSAHDARLAAAVEAEAEAELETPAVEADAGLGASVAVETPAEE